MRTFLRFVGATLIAILVGLMLAPRDSVAGGEVVWDKAAHFIAFGLILWSLGALFRRLPRPWAALTAVAIGGAVEIIQGFVGRDPSWGDFLADVLGVAAALAVWLVWRGFQPRGAAQTSNTR